MDFAGHHFAFQRDHRVGHHLDMGQRTADQLQRPAVEAAGDAELVGAEGRGLGRRRGGEMQAGADADVEREGQHLVARRRLVARHSSRCRPASMLIARRSLPTTWKRWIEVLRMPVSGSLVITTPASK
jgi:hypothetical protein